MTPTPAKSPNGVQGFVVRNPRFFQNENLYLKNAMAIKRKVSTYVKIVVIIVVRMKSRLILKKFMKYALFIEEYGLSIAHSKQK